MLQELVLIDFHELDDRDLGDEQDRAADRVNVPYPARVIVGGDEDATAMTAHLVNLSEGGAALRVYGRIEPGDCARLMIDMARGPVVISIRAVWSRNLPGGRMVGVTFDALAPVQEAAITKLLADRD